MSIQDHFITLADSIGLGIRLMFASQHNVDACGDVVSVVSVYRSGEGTLGKIKDTSKT